MIAKAIAVYLKEHGITQSSLCEKTGLSGYCVRLIFNNKRKLSIDEYEKICMALNVPFDFFFKNSS